MKIKLAEIVQKAGDFIIWLDGKKMVIGGGVVLLGKFVQLFDSATGHSIQEIGDYILAIGALDKTRKLGVKIYKKRNGVNTPPVSENASPDASVEAKNED